MVCELYCGIYGAVVTLGDVRYTLETRWYALAGLMGFAFIVTAVAAVIISKNGGKKDEEKTNAVEGINDNVAMQAKIQEMVEKEVQARLSAVQGGGTRNEVPQSSKPNDGSSAVKSSQTVDKSPIGESSQTDNSSSTAQSS